MGPWWDPVKTLRSDAKILDPVITGTILKAIRLGAFQDAAARYAGIKPARLRDWIRIGNGKGDRPDVEGAYSAFVQKLELATAEAIVKNLELLDTIKNTKGKAAIRAIIWHLSKQSAKHYGDRIEVTGEIQHRKLYSFEEPAIPIEGKVVDVEAKQISEQAEEGEEPVDDA